MSMDITSANATVVLDVQGLFSAELQQFSADASFTGDNIQMAEVRMGVDGKLVAGQVNSIKTVTINLEASSPSLSFMTLLRQSMDVNRKIYECNMIINVPSIGKRYSLSKGVLESCKALPDGNRVLAPTTWTFNFEQLNEEGL